MVANILNHAPHPLNFLQLAQWRSPKLNQPVEDIFKTIFIKEKKYRSIHISDFTCGSNDDFATLTVYPCQYIG